MIHLNFIDTLYKQSIPWTEGLFFLGVLEFCLMREKSKYKILQMQRLNSFLRRQNAAVNDEESQDLIFFENGEKSSKSENSREKWQKYKRRI